SRLRQVCLCLHLVPDSLVPWPSAGTKFCWLRYVVIEVDLFNSSAWSATKYLWRMYWCIPRLFIREVLLVSYDALGGAIIEHASKRGRSHSMIYPPLLFDVYMDLDYVCCRLKRNIKYSLHGNF
uniref:Uncharacterized protein n=1 Tax=Aegilops tauschii subsp. strangulata TaxID=200361 RepID=A0A452YF56_AEGTS